MSVPPFVDTGWLAKHLAEVRVVDVRWSPAGGSGREAYDAGHLPGAVFVDLPTSLAGTGSPGAGRHPLPDPSDFADAMGAAGIGDDTAVVAYDDQGGIFAARLVWMLRALGHDAALLDGGISAWAGPLETETPDVPVAHFTAAAWPQDRLASIDDASDRHHTVIDARPVARYRGDDEAFDARAGHIPGSRSLAVLDHLGANGSLLPDAALRDRFAAAGVVGAENEDVVSTCGSGVTACHNLLLMEHLGLGRGRLFPGSWSQYSAATERPVAVGDAPG